jgi:ribosomal protein S18 acetylase RimI-like enzyme
MLTQRPVNLKADRDFLLDLACMSSYESLPAWYRTQSYRAYRERWFESTFPTVFMEDLAGSVKKERTVAEIWQEDGLNAGFLWLGFEDSPYNKVISTLHNLSVAPNFQRRGIGRMMLQAAESKARERSAGILRVETSIENQPTQSLCQKAGFTVARLLYEKELDESQAAGSVRV